MAVKTYPNGIAPLPAGNYRFGAKGGRMAQAWQFVWDRLDRTAWTNGQELADKAAAAFDLKPVSVTEMLSRMRGTGVLEQEMIPVPTKYVRPQNRTEYVVRDWDAPVKLTKIQRVMRYEDVIPRVLPHVKGMMGERGWADRRELLDEVATRTGLDTTDIAKTLAIFSSNGLVTVRRMIRNCEYMANRPRVHYRIAAGAAVHDAEAAR